MNEERVISAFVWCRLLPHLCRWSVCSCVMSIILDWCQQVRVGALTSENSGEGM